MKTLSTLILTIFVSGFLTAQTESVSSQNRFTKIIAPLKPGDTIPNDISSQLLQLPGRTKNIYVEAKGRLLVLDFFATWCGDCISLLPKLEFLQKKYRNNVTFVVVTDESRTVIDTFLKRHPKLNSRSLLFVTDDEIFSQLFPHRLIPHGIIIDQKGKFITTTEGYSLTNDNIYQALQGDYSSFTPKNDNLTFNTDKPLLSESNVSDDTSFLYRSILTSFKPGIAGQVKIDRLNNGLIKRIVCTNIQPLYLFNVALSKFVFSQTNKNRTFNLVRDSAQFDGPKTEKEHAEWRKTHNNCYELIMPTAVSESDFFSSMFNDLNRVFNFKARIESRNIPCWELVRISNDSSLLSSAGGQKQYANTGLIRNGSISDLVIFLNGYKDMEPVLDVTHYNMPVDMKLDFVHQFERGYYPDIDVIRKCLNLYGLDLKKVVRPYDCMILSDE